MIRNETCSGSRVRKLANIFTKKENKSEIIISSPTSIERERQGNEVTYDTKFSRRRALLLKSTDSGIAIAEPSTKENSKYHKCLLDKDIIEKCKPKFLNNTTNNLDNAHEQFSEGKNRIEEIRKLLKERRTASLATKYNSTDFPPNKFVVNLFESRRSLRINEKNRPKCPSAGGIKIINDSSENGLSTSTLVTAVESKSSCCNQSAKKDVPDMFIRLKKLRDIEYVKMKQSLNVLKLVLNKPTSDLKDRLLAEKILLEHELRFNLLSSKLENDIREKIMREPRRCTIDISISNIQFEVQDDMESITRNRFFVLVLSNDTDLLISEPTAPVGNNLLFKKMFCFKNVDDDFFVKAEVFLIVLNSERSFLESIFKKRTTFRIAPGPLVYGNVNTCELQESDALKSAFVKCGSVSFTSEDVGRNSFQMTEAENSSLGASVGAKIQILDVHLHVYLSGFLTIGKSDSDDNFVYWDRRWCELQGSNFFIYNYPQDKVLDKTPKAVFDLKASLEIEGIRKCPKRKNVIVKMKSTKSLEQEHNLVCLKYKDKCGIQRHLLAADNNFEAEKWTKDIQFVMDSLRKLEKA